MANHLGNNLAPLTAQDLTNLRRLDDDDNRVAMYIHDFELTGEQQNLLQAHFASFSGYEGAVAECANQEILNFIGSQYPKEGIVGVSRMVSQDHVDHKFQNVQNGGNGYISGREMLENAQGVWDRQGIGPYFPGRLFALTNIFFSSDEPRFNQRQTEIGASKTLRCAISEYVPFLRTYGLTREHFSDPTKYQWYHEKVHGQDISYVTELGKRKVVFLEKSDYAVRKVPNSIRLREGQRITDIFLARIPGVNDDDNDVAPAVVNRRPPARIPAPNRPQVEEDEFQQYLKNHGLSANDVNEEEKKAIIEFANTYAAANVDQRLTFREFVDIFEWGNEKLMIVAQATNNRKLMFAAQLGHHGLEVAKMTSQLPGALMNAPTLFAAFNPLFAVGMAIFSFTNLFRSQPQANMLQPVLDQLRQIANQIDAMHREMTQGFNLLLAGQENLLNQMIENFRHLEHVIRQEHERLGFAILKDLGGLRQYLNLIHHDLGAQLQEFYIQSYQDLRVDIDHALTFGISFEEQRRRLNHLVDTPNLARFENWLINRSGSDMLNGYRYVHYLEGHMSNSVAQKLVNSMLVNQNAHLECLIGYLGELARGILGNEAFANNPVDVLCNPTFWLKGADVYLKVSRALDRLGIVHNSKLNAIKAKGDKYLEFIKTLKLQSGPLFGELIRRHARSQIELRDQARTNFSTQLLGQGFNLATRPTYAATTSYQCNAVKISEVVGNADLNHDILSRFQAYKDLLDTETQNIQTRFSASFAQMLEGLLNGRTPVELAANLDRPLVPIARHKTHTGRHDSHLDMNNDHHFFVGFEQFNFSLPLLLTSLFNGSAALRNAIPNSFYLAELLNIGGFEISLTGKYVRGSNTFIGTHAPLNQLRGCHNYEFKFEIYFVTNVRTKILEFDCHTEQLPVNEFADIVGTFDKVAQRALALHVEPYDRYAFVNGINAKLAALHHIPKFTEVNRLAVTLVNPAQVLASLNQSIQVQLNQIQTANQAFLHSPINQAALNEQVDSMNSSHNLILAFMKLCGFNQLDITSVSQKHLLSLNSVLAGQQVNVNAQANNQAVAPAAIDFSTEVTQLINTRADHLDLKGFQVAEVELMVNAFKGLELIQRRPMGGDTINPSGFRPIPAANPRSIEEIEREVTTLLNELNLPRDFNHELADLVNVVTARDHPPAPNAAQRVVGIVQNLLQFMGE